MRASLLRVALSALACEFPSADSVIGTACSLARTLLLHTEPNTQGVLSLRQRGLMLA